MHTITIISKEVIKLTTVRQVLNRILSNDYDYAKELNGVGFNKPDTGYAHWIASFPQWTEVHQNDVYDMLKKYTRQYDEKWEELKFEKTFDIDKSVFNKKEKGVNRLFLNKATTGRITGIKLNSQYGFKDFAKSIPGRSWNPDEKVWLYPIREDSLKSLYELITNEEVLERHIVTMDDETRDYITKNKDVVKNTSSKSGMESTLKSNHLDIAMVEDALHFRWFTQYDFKDITKNIGRYPHTFWNWDLSCFECVTNNNKITNNIIEILNNDTIRNKHLVTLSDKCKKFIDNYTTEKIDLEAAIKKIGDIKNGKVVLKRNLPIINSITPFEHQIVGYNIGMATHSTTLLMEMGCGKTLTEVAIAGTRFLKGEIKKCLIIAPLSVLGVWRKEFKTMSTIETNITVINGTTLKRRKLLRNQKTEANKLNIMIVSYDGISSRKKKTIVDGKERVTSTGGIYGDILDWIGEEGGDETLVILDESQRIKNRNSNRAKSIHKIGDLCKYKNILTGTPITQNPLDIFSQYRFLNSNIFGVDFYAFRGKYTLMGGYKNKEVVGYKNIDDLQKRTHSIGYRVTKDDALDLPETVDMNVYCELKKSKKIYDALCKECIKEIYDESDKSNNANFIAITKLLRLSQITGGFLSNNYELKEDGSIVEIDHGKTNITATQVGTEKLDVLRELVEDFPVDKKLVIFCRFIPEINAIEKMMIELGRTVKSLVGKTKNREKLIESFQEDTNPNVIIIQLQTGGLGITLTRADTAIFYSYDYSFANYEQAKARIHRIGQDNKCTYIHLLAEGTIDESVMSALHNKKSVADYIVDKNEDISEFVKGILFAGDDMGEKMEGKKEWYDYD